MHVPKITFTLWRALNLYIDMIGNYLTVNSDLILGACSFILLPDLNCQPSLVGMTLTATLMCRATDPA